MGEWFLCTRKTMRKNKEENGGKNEEENDE